MLGTADSARRLPGVPMRRSVLVLLLAVAAALAPAQGAAADPAGRAAGTFVASVDFGTLTALPAANGTHCELTVQGVLTFSGTLVGTAGGTTTAYVLAPCAEVLASPPGTYRDVFTFTGTFTGTVDGSATTGSLDYAGVSFPGGAIGATIQLDGASTARLRADATLGVGGTYTGVAQP